MGLLSFFRKLGAESKVEGIVTKKLAFSEIENWLSGKREENETKEKEILLNVTRKIENFIKELRNKMEILSAFDVDAKKETDHIKNVVKDGREKYIETMEDLIERLNTLDEPNLERFIKKINKIFFDFNKASYKNYERATILIGKEMANIKGYFKTFSKDLLEIFENNKEISELFKRIEFLKLRLDSLGPITEERKLIKKSIAMLNEKIEKTFIENERLLSEIEEIKQSPDYKEMLEKKEKINILKESSKSDLFALKQLINFKALANFFHINEFQMKILKDHKEDFHTHFEKDRGEGIISLLDESKLNNSAILDKTKLIRERFEEINNHKKELKEDATQKVYLQIKEAELDMENLKSEKAKKEKRDEKLKILKEELVSELTQELGKMNVKLVTLI